MEASYKNYVNQYSTNGIALNKAQKSEERDKKRFMSYKFSLTSAADFKWPGNIYSKCDPIRYSFNEKIYLYLSFSNFARSWS